MNSKNNLSKLDSVNKIIGVVGAGRGVGTTHICLMLSAFLTHIVGKKVALVELSNENCLRQAGLILEKFSDKEKIIRKVKIYKQSEIGDLANIISAGYDYVVIDFGCNFRETKAQFLMCSSRIVVGNLSWWKLHETVGFITKARNDKSYDRWIYCASFWTKQGISYLKKNYKINVHVIPFVPDPLCFSEDIVNILWDFVEIL